MVVYDTYIRHHVVPIMISLIEVFAANKGDTELRVYSGYVEIIIFKIKRYRKPKRKFRMDNPETLATLGTQET